MPLGATCGPDAPPNCLPVQITKHSVSAAQGFSRPVSVGGVLHKSWSGARNGFPIGDGFAVTDYFAEGLSFGAAPWYAYLAKPDRGRLQRASVLVTLTRFRDWDAVWVWAPLWRPGDEEERKRVVNSFAAAAKPSADLTVAEERTLRDLPERVRNLLQ